MLVQQHRSLTQAVLVLSLLVASACAIPKSKNPNSTTSSTQGKPRRTETIVILGTNDLHGALFPWEGRTADIESVPYEQGGVAMLASYVRRLRSDHGSRLVWLDAGDQFQGAIQSELEQGAPVVDFFNLLDLNASTVGDQDYGFGATQVLKERMSQAKYPYVATSFPTPGTIPSMIINAGRVRVGVVGITSYGDSSHPRTDTELRNATVNEAGRLRSMGAQVIVAVAHLGLKCAQSRHFVSAPTWKPEDIQGGCGPTDELVRLLRMLPGGTLDAVVSGHSHHIVHHWVAGVPVIQTTGRGQQIQLIHIPVDLDDGRVVATEVRIEGPIPVCKKIFKNQGNCDGSQAAPKKGRGELVAPVFRGESLRPDPQTLAILEPIQKRAAATLSRVVGTAAGKIEHHRTKESPLGNLVADAMKASVGADIALMNSGAIRSAIDAGPITFEELYRALPFNTSVSVATLTGKEIKTLIRVSQSGSRGFFPVSGLSLKLIDLHYEAPFSDLNGDKKIETWEVNRVVDARLADGTQIRDESTYKVALPDFLALGGDDLAWVMGQIDKGRIENRGNLLLRDLVETYIKDRKPLNSAQEPLLQAGKPRIRLVSGKSEGPRRRRKARRKG